jgi:ribose 5-phosphate isomerase RpiB
MNVLSLGAKVIDSATAATVLAAFLAATPSDAERFVRRTNKVQQIEKEQG